MKEYTGDRVFQALRPGFASNPDPLGTPTEPPLDEYEMGVVPLQTYPAPYHNWFFRSITDNDNRTADAFGDIYGAFDYILTQAEQSYTEDPSDLFSALHTLWGTDITAEANRALAAESLLQDNIDAEAATARANEETLQDNIDTTNTNLSVEVSVRSSADTGLDTRITAIESKIPTQATDINQLADKAFVNSSIENMAARYITSSAGGDTFPTNAALMSGPYFNNGATITPTTNDYAVITADETHNGEQWRYVWDGSQWDAQYRVNSAPFTAAQQSALDSGITSGLVTKLNDLDTGANYTNRINAKQDQITSIGSSNLLTAPGAAGGQPGAKAISDFVQLTGNQTITGGKNFTSAVSLPTSSADLRTSGSPTKAATQGDIFATVSALGSLKKAQSLIIGTEPPLGDTYYYFASDVDVWIPRDQVNITSIVQTALNGISGSIAGSADQTRQGGKVIFRRGTYTFPSPITIGQAYTIEGESPQGCFLVATARLFEVHGDAAEIDLSNMSIVLDPTYFAADGIVVHSVSPNARGSRYHNLFFYGTLYKVPNSFWALLYITINSTPATSNRQCVIIVEKCAFYLQCSSTFLVAAYRQYPACIYMKSQSPNQIIIRDCIIDMSTANLTLSQQSPILCGIVARTVSLGAIRAYGFQIISNQIYGYGATYGIALGEANAVLGVIIRGNTMISLATQAILPGLTLATACVLMPPGIQGLIISDNAFSVVPRASSTTLDGAITAEGGIMRVIITNNAMFHASSGASLLYGYIHIQNWQTAQWCRITHNYSHGPISTLILASQESQANPASAMMSAASTLVGFNV